MIPPLLGESLNHPECQIVVGSIDHSSMVECIHRKQSFRTMPTRISKATNTAISKAWDSICGRIADGESLPSICKDYSFSRYAVLAYVRNGDRKIREQYQQVRRDSAHAFLDMALDTVSSADVDHRREKTRCNVLFSLAEKMNPTEYAPRSRQDINVTKLDVNQILADANARLASSDTAAFIEGTAIRINDLDAVSHDSNGHSDDDTA